MKTSPQPWLNLLCEQAKHALVQHIELLVYESNLGYPLRPLLKALQSSPAAAKLLEGSPENAIADSGPLLVPVSLEQIAQAAWRWRDCNRQPQSVSGNYRQPTQLPRPLPVLCLKSEQAANLLTGSAAEEYRRRWSVQPHDNELTQQEPLMRHLLHAQLAANRERLLDRGLREDFIRLSLAGNPPVTLCQQELPV